MALCIQHHVSLTEVGNGVGQALVCLPKAEQPSQVWECLVVCVYICQGLLLDTVYKKEV